ncbi:hypothetical protein AALB19_08710 [Oscillospiraceae bacterium 50-58]
MKHIRNTRKQEQTKHHRDYMKEGTKLVVQQQNQNFKAIMQQEYSGIMGALTALRSLGALASVKAVPSAGQSC